jgi:hypothetical protein
LNLSPGIARDIGVQVSCKNKVSGTKKGISSFFSRELRKDVIFKNLLRDIRKYFVKDLDAVTSYKKRRRCQGKSEAYRKCVREYVEGTIDA